jgi:hypothetical protein
MTKAPRGARASSVAPNILFATVVNTGNTQNRFGVYDYLSQPEIESDVEKIYRVFPGEVADKIKKKLGK